MSRALESPRLWPTWSGRVARQLSWKLGAIVVLMSAALLIIATVAAAAIQQVLAASEIRAHAQEQTRLAYQLRGDVQSYTNALLDMLWTRTDRTQELELHTDRVAEHLAAARVDLSDPEQLGLLDKLDAQRMELNLLAGEMIEHSRQGRDTEAAILWLRGKNMAEVTYDLAERYYSYQDERAAEAQRLAQSRRNLGMLMLGVSTVVAMVLGIGATTLISRRLVRALSQLTRAAGELAGGTQTKVSIVSDDELGVLARAFNTMADDLLAQRAAQQRWGEELEQQVTARTSELQTALDHQRQLGDTIRRMSTPLIPVLDGVLVMPLVGLLDAERIVQVQQSIVEGIQSHRAHLMIIDITGISVIDSFVARNLIDSIALARLLGARTEIVGVSPEVAQTLVSLGVDLTSFKTRSDLRSAVVHALPIARQARTA